MLPQWWQRRLSQGALCPRLSQGVVVLLLLLLAALLCS
jgi:hypothetical protein